MKIRILNEAFYARPELVGQIFPAVIKTDRTHVGVMGYDLNKIATNEFDPDYMFSFIDDEFEIVETKS